MATHTNLSSQEAKTLLDNMQINGTAKLNVAEDGTILYVFKGLGLSSEDKDFSSEV